jgi:hypothetical protein
MRWYILRTLVQKEAHRHLAHRGGLALAAGLVLAPLLLAPVVSPGASAGGAECCFIDYWQDGPWIAHLRRNVPPELEGRVRFRPVAEVPTEGDVIVYPPGAGAIQVRTGGPGRRATVWVWHPGRDGGGLAVFEAWFWKESARYFRRQAVRSAAAGPGTGESGAVPAFKERRSPIQGGAGPRSALAPALVLFALCLACVYLLPAFTCEERERGLLLAQALTPASPGEIVAAKFLFYPTLGVALAALPAAVSQPAALGRPFFWLTLLVAAGGATGIGLTIGSLARTQRAASLGALGYMLAAALMLVACRQVGLPGVANLFLEYHSPRLLHAALEGEVSGADWGRLAGAAVLAGAWACLATGVFRRRGWQ